MKESDEHDGIEEVAQGLGLSIPAPEDAMQARNGKGGHVTAENAERLARWERFHASIRANSVHTGGERYTRDELHERR